MKNILFCNSNNKKITIKLIVIFFNYTIYIANLGISPYWQAPHLCGQLSISPLLQKPLLKLTTTLIGFLSLFSLLSRVASETIRSPFAEHSATKFFLFIFLKFGLMDKILYIIVKKSNYLFFYYFLHLQ